MHAYTSPWHCVVDNGDIFMYICINIHSIYVVSCFLLISNMNNWIHLWTNANIMIFSKEKKDQRNLTRTLTRIVLTLNSFYLLTMVSSLSFLHSKKSIVHPRCRHPPSIRMCTQWEKEKMYAQISIHF